MVSLEDYKDPAGSYNGRLVARMTMGSGQSAHETSKSNDPHKLAIVALANLPADGSAPRVAVVLERNELTLDESTRFSKVYVNLLASIQRRMTRANAHRTNSQSNSQSNQG